MIRCVQKIHSFNGSADPSPRPERTRAPWQKPLSASGLLSEVITNMDYRVNSYSWKPTSCVGSKVPTPQKSLSLLKREPVQWNVAFSWISTQQKPHKSLASQSGPQTMGNLEEFLYKDTLSPQTSFLPSLHLFLKAFHLSKCFKYLMKPISTFISPWWASCLNPRS